MSEIANKYILTRKRKKKAWLKNTTMEIAEERRTAKSRWGWEGWAKLNKEFMKAANADKRDYLKERCQHLEQSNKNPKEVSKAIKQITGKWAQTEVINDKYGNTRTESEAIMKRWAEHCHQLDQEPQNHQWTTSHEHEREPDITQEEVQTALRALPNDKAPGIDETPIELLSIQEKTGSPCCGSCVIRYGGAKSGPMTDAEESPCPYTIKESERMLKLSHDQPYGPCQQGPSEDHCLKNPTEIFIRNQRGTIWHCERKGSREQMVNIRIIMEKYK